MKKKLIVLLVIICIIIAVLYIKPFSRLFGKSGTDSSETVNNVDSIVVSTDEMGKGVICVSYLNNYYAIDKNEMVVGNYSTKPADAYLVTGIEFTKLAYGSKAETENVLALDYALTTALNLEKQGINIEEIRICDYNEIELITGGLTIKLGRNDKTEEKISDLKDFVADVQTMNGTLYMQDANANNYGYTFRPDNSSDSVSLSDE